MSGLLLALAFPEGAAPLSDPTPPPAAPSAPAPAPLAAYGKLPFIEGAALSPDGQRLAYAVTDGEARRIRIKDLASGTIVGGLNAGVNKVREIQWAGPAHLIITSSVTGYIPDVSSPRAEWYLGVDYNLTTHKAEPLISLNADAGGRGTLNTIDGAPQVRFIGGHPFVLVQGTVFVDGRGQEGLFKVDLDRGDATSVVFEGYEHTSGYAVDAKGAPLAELEYDARSGRGMLKVWRGHWQEAASEAKAPFDQATIMGLGRDGASIAVSFDMEKETVLRELSSDGRIWSPAVPAPDDLIWDPATGRMIGEHSLVADDSLYSFYDARDQAIWKAVLAAYPGNLVSLKSFSDDHRKFVIRADSPTEGPAFALVDLNTHRGDWLGPEYPDLKAADIGPQTPIAFKAKDGLALTGYLTLPRGKQAKGLPLVVFPHGGPAARDEPGFDWWAQAMASRGYAVLQVNYRGSQGLGWDLMAAGFGEWGRKMQTDLSDGVRWLADQGIIDPARVCIVGASYGGYAALAGATLDTGVYRCAASVAGPSDLKRMVSQDKSDAGDQGVGIERYWLRYMGPREALEAVSPVAHVDRVTIPILLVHGKDDTVVPYVQSQIMADALRKAGKPVAFVTLNKEDHWLSQGATRLQMLEAVMGFLRTYNPPD